MATKNYTKQYINKNYLIKVFGIYGGKKINKLVGCAGIIAMIGEDMLDKFIARADKAGEDKCVCKLRRGLQVTFYVH